MANSYDSKDIVILEGLDAVRLRPGMYVGSTGSKGVHHILWEIVDNSMDEIANGFGSRISVTLHKDGSATVEDNGRGIPVSIHPTLKKPGVEVVFTKLHAGGKFDNSNYAYSGGLHGVGASVTNALSSSLEVTVSRDKKIYQMAFAAVEEGDKVRGGVVVKPLTEIGKTDKTGTKVTFKPDSRIFLNNTFVADIIRKRLKELAFLNKGVESGDKKCELARRLFLSQKSMFSPDSLGNKTVLAKNVLEYAGQGYFPVRCLFLLIITHTDAK